MTESLTQQSTPYAGVGQVPDKPGGQKLILKVFLCIEASHSFLYFFFGQKVHCFLGEEIAKTRPETCVAMVHLFPIRISVGHQKNKAGNWEESGRD